MLAYIDHYMSVFDVHYPTEFLKVTCQTNHSPGRHRCWVGASRRLLAWIRKSWVTYDQKIQGGTWSREKYIINSGLSLLTAS